MFDRGGGAMPGAGTQRQKTETTTPIVPPETAQLTPDAVLSEFGKLCVALPVSGALIAVRDLKGMSCVVSFGNAPAVGSRLPADFAFTNECIDSGEVVLCRNSDSDPRIPPAVAAQFGYRSAVAVPIRAQDHVIGAIEMFCSVPSAISPVVAEDLKGVAKSWAALMIFDATNGGQPLVGGSLEQPVVLPNPLAAPELRPAQPAPKSIPVAATAARPVMPAALPAAGVKIAHSVAQLPSDRPTPTRVWLIAVVLLVCLLLLFLVWFKGTDRGQNAARNADSNRGGVDQVLPGFSASARFNSR
jgi:GAF domain